MQDAVWDVEAEEDDTGQSEVGQSWWSEGQLWGWILSTDTCHQAVVTHLHLVEEGRSRLCAGSEISPLLPRHSAESLRTFKDEQGSAASFLWPSSLTSERWW